MSTITAYTYHYSHNIITAHFALLQMGTMPEASNPDSQYIFQHSWCLQPNIRSLGLPEA